MFDGLWEPLLWTVPYLSYFILVGGATAIVVWFVKRIRDYFNERSALDD